MEYEAVIGLEVHAQLLTQSKLFCSCSTAFGASPNGHVCAVCLGLPGALPVLNGRAVQLAIRAALATDCRVVERSIFARKQYFYPDLPKGYQISQYEEPFSEHGHLDVAVDGATRRIGIRRIHMEEDAGKNVHGVGGDSLVDLNRAGTPLIEIVSDPDIRSSAEAAAYMRALRDILVFVGVNDGNLEEGSFRCDANVSVRPRGQAELGTRTELKNLNSFRFVQKAIDVEIGRQIALVSSGGQVRQETRAFDPETNKTRTLRSKEEAHDYRYFPDPDLPPLVIDAALVAAERAAMPPLPSQYRQGWMTELGLSEAAATTLSRHPEIARFFEESRRAAKNPVTVANWVQTEVLRDTTVHGLTAKFPVTPKQIAELVELIEAGTISGKQGKEVYAVISGTEQSPRDVVAERGMKSVSDEGALEAVCREVVAESGKQVEQYRSGKKGILGYFVGQVMKKTGGSANPKMVNDLLSRLLEDGS